MDRKIISKIVKASGISAGEMILGNYMTEAEAISLFKCLADKSRLQILKSLAVEDMYVERLAGRLGLTAPTISFHLKKLSDAGAVTAYKSQYYMMYSLNKEIFQTSILDILQQESDEAQKQAKRDALPISMMISVPSAVTWLASGF